ncbi:PREDICTED: ras and Rab interactor 3-like [Cyprinodon variegatus]|uniref:ras and Rab interactor 3-like n=1 Tax=Cyprinodon variegatus TaxID=28743 RepID=UPI000742B545|nr:PREDICTED: ras and Rab interactor 3-like [Cyprinodon variegatus]
MAQQEEPLYDFPEPSQPSKQRLPQRGRSSLRSISVLDRLLLTVPVWLQLSINPANALHILQREPPGLYPTLSLESSAISFPDLPRLISFYCVSRDVLPFPLELPEAIARAASHKELESISHMGIEFWRSHLNVRGPREAPKARKEEKQPDAASSAIPAILQTDSTAQPESGLQPDSENQPSAAEPHSNGTKSYSNPTLFQEFCPITTRSPRELDCGSGQGALCFINPLFLQSQSAFSRRRMFKRSLKVRVSTETSSLLSPPLAPPPPPPLMPKTKGRRKGLKAGGFVKPNGDTFHVAQVEPPLIELEEEPPSGDLSLMSDIKEEGQPECGSSTTEDDKQEVPAALLDDYLHPNPVISAPSLSPYQSPSISPRAPPLFPKTSYSLSPRNSPSASPSISPYQSPSLSPKVPLSLSPYDSPNLSPSPSPVTVLNTSALAEQDCCADAAPSGSGQEAVKEVTHTDKNTEDDGETKHLNEEREKEGMGVDLERSAEDDGFSSVSDLKESLETPSQSPHKPDMVKECKET